VSFIDEVGREDEFLSALDLHILSCGHQATPMMQTRLRSCRVDQRFSISILSAGKLSVLK
jgi:hypothetical protein